ncbi:hypothetical protein J8Z28_04920 [Pseudoalteromonas sp. SCSIO 43088]|uniref:hypothetical protein n=1 Tax=Pseudoalteromonas sp. SCSIO 43088 TaxID=2822846 RepID=UPI00202AC334|nr:hypothetical protein [Pseudoalteromonas sp. SCSIO 43088]URQ87234.1 hypothetical protein J8Z28_04920 [Pseudoalteromonas sp. SCSIO 43088]
MSTQAYDEKNQLDYDEYTRKLNDALNEISKNTKLKATINEVARLSGIGRNTVRDRGFPKKRLKEIKEERKKKALEEKKQKQTELEIITEERDKLAKEVVHWFSEFVKAKKDRDSFERQLQRSIDNASYYKREFNKQKETIKALEAKNEQLKDLLRDLK